MTMVDFKIRLFGFVVLLVCCFAIGAGCSSEDDGGENGPSSPQPPLPNATDEEQSLKWSWNETDGSRTEMSTNAIVPKLMQEEFLKLRWDGDSQPSMKIEFSSKRSLEIQFSKDSNSVVAILTYPIKQEKADESVTRRKTKALSNPNEGLMLLNQYSKNKDAVELSKEWDNN